MFRTICKQTIKTNRHNAIMHNTTITIIKIIQYVLVLFSTLENNTDYRNFLVHSFSVFFYNIVTNI